MSEIDRQRIAAVSRLEALGYTFRSADWHPPLHEPFAALPEADAMHSLLLQRADALIGLHGRLC